MFICLRHRIICAERTRCVAYQNVIAENLAVELHGLIHVGNSDYGSCHSTGKLALVNEYLLVFYNLENISEKVLDIETWCAVRKIFRNCAVLPFRRYLLMESLDVTAIEFCCKHAQVSGRYLKRTWFRLAL